jgi:diguanylate cyclase (GGDEF)-like protein
MPESIRQLVLRLPAGLAVLALSALVLLGCASAVAALLLWLQGDLWVELPPIMALTLLPPLLAVVGLCLWVVRLLKEGDAARQAQRTLGWLDPLTGVMTRSRFLEVAERERLLSERNWAPMAVALMDLDGFKRVNDAGGHALGDAALRVVAQACAQALRTTDMVARWDGEEFALLLPGATQASAMETAERVRAAVACATAAMPGLPGHCTASVGVAVIEPGDKLGLERAVVRADAALFAAKHAGKDRVMVADAA